MRFVVGEMAILSYSRMAPGSTYVGSLIEVLEVGPFAAGQLKLLPSGVTLRFKMDADYIVRLLDGHLGAPLDHQLIKLQDPDAGIATEEDEAIYQGIADHYYGAVEK
jgi:hypothetical protein